MRADAHAEDISAGAEKLRIRTLAEWLPELHVDNVRVGEAVIDLSFATRDDSTPVHVRRRTGDLDVIVRL
ncbi:MAG TPA: hypothetical protein VK992_04370 [Candidatus Caenarcaniphilales bacterium]|nr:hypothetical protein [Candidatus Caenarcaniphilales bacterium]